VNTSSPSSRSLGKLPGIQHKKAIKALQRAGFVIERQSGHIIMAKGDVLVVVPRNNPINPYTMYGIVADAGLTVEEFRKLL
jgi:predicted RNA binding protein YcfA (HicA-like mRNA interferase family)